jgi:hypothetical protein
VFPNQLRLLVVACALAFARPSHAQEEAAAGLTLAKGAAWEVAGAASYVSPPVRGAANPFGAGFVGRVGRSFGPIYLGATGAGYSGGTDVDLHTHSAMFGGEAGFSLQRRLTGDVQLIVRPGVGVGATLLVYTVPSTTVVPASGPNPASRPTVDIVTSATHRTSAPRPSTSTSTGTGTGSSSTTTGSSGTTADAGTPSELIVSNDTTTVTRLYVQPSLTVLLQWKWAFTAVKASALVIPNVPDGFGDDSTWLAYGLEGELGVRF